MARFVFSQQRLDASQCRLVRLLRVMPVELGGDELLERRVRDDLSRQVVRGDAPVRRARLTHGIDVLAEAAADRCLDCGYFVVTEVGVRPRGSAGAEGRPRFGQVIEEHVIVLPLLHRPHDDEVADVAVGLEVLEEVCDVVGVVALDQQRRLDDEDIGGRERVYVERAPRDLEQFGEAPAQALVRLIEGEHIFAAGDETVVVRGERSLFAGERVCDGLD